MELLAFFIALLLAFAIPIILIVISVIKYYRHGEISKTIFRFVIAIVVHVFVSLFVLMFFGGFINAVIHKKVPTWREILFALLMVFIYAVIGCFLCGFVNDGLLKPWLIFTEDYNKAPSIFDNK